ncbi:MAG TPA: alpha/beta hydrolase [Ktedonobacteraceae bacterium]|nr:alpha/beta hydrolase [Ktedonobacteraceae bacterium]
MSKRIGRFRPSLKQVILSSLGGSIGIVGILFTVALYVVETLIRPQKRNLFDEYTFSPYEFDLPAEAVTFPPLQGSHEVSGWYVPREDASTTILVCPGYRSRKSELLGLSAQLWKAGHNLLIFDYYGHGTAIGKPITLGYREISDFLGAVAYAKERAPQARLGVVAYSMGAAIAIMGAARNQEIEAVVADSAFATHWSVVDYNVRHVFPLISTLFVWLADYLMWLRAGYRFRQVEPIRDIGRIAPRPILLIHGGKDSMVDPHDATLLYRAANEPKELWLLPEADHCGAYFVDRKAYTAKMINFFDLYLKKPRLQLVEDLVDEQPQNKADLSEAS